MTATSTQLPDVVAAAHAARALENPAFISLFDVDATAAALDAAPDGPLHGVPFAVKDNIDVAGLATTAGYPGFTAPARSSAQAVRRLVAAGAVPIGKTNMDQFATGLVGTRSPYGTCHCADSADHVSGGSSSGSAIAVATGVVPFALATDTAGSGRVPAAFNGIVGVKPSRGLVSTRGVFPACPSLDCVSILSPTVTLGRALLDVIAGFDPLDPWSRNPPTPLPAGIARTMRVVGVPVGPLDLDELHRHAWLAALEHVRGTVRLVPVDIEPLLAAARLLYGGPFAAERFAAFGRFLQPDGPDESDDPGLDPVVRKIVLAAGEANAADLFAATHRLRELTRQSEIRFAGVDALMLPVTPGHPRIREVLADPIGINARLGTYTNMVNLLDLCAVALPMGRRADGLPFGVQLLAPAFADAALLDLAARVLGEGSQPTTRVTTVAPGAPAAPGRSLLAVCGAHLSGQPLNPVLREAGGHLQARAQTAGGYRMVLLDGHLPRPGLIDDGTGPDDGLELELWDVPLDLVRSLQINVEAPLQIGLVRLADGSSVPGFLAAPAADGADISRFGGWRAYLDAVGAP